MPNIVEPDAQGVSSSDIVAVENTARELVRQGTMDIIELLSYVDRLTTAGKREAAKDLYRLWIDHTASPYLFVACFNYAVMLAADDEYPQAESMNRRALEINPDFIQARLNLGNNLEQLGRDEECLEQWRTVLNNKKIADADNKALHLHALNNLGRLLETKRDLAESLRMLERSRDLDPTQLDVLLHIGHLRQKQCIWPLNMFRKGNSKEDVAKGCSPLALLAATNDPELQLAAAKWFVDYKFSAENQRLAPIGGYRHEKLRIGYLSSDFCLHAVSLLTAELYELHDREKFEVYGFCWSRDESTYLRNRVVKAMDHFTKIGAMSDREAADCIRSHEIDILIDLQGLTSGARPLILSYRPAPVQMTYLGFPGPTGLPCIDYVIADKYLIPEESAQFFTEKPLYLSNCFQVSDSKRPVGVTPCRDNNNLPEDAFVFCSFNNNYKFTEELFAVWMRILKRVPQSVLWLLADNEWAHKNLLRAAKKHGVKKERLIFAPRVSPADYLARYQLADLFLDTFPFNGGTTANDALWMGLPLLTYSGKTFASRMAGSLLTNLGLPELIATDFKEYEEKAVRLAKKPSEYSRIRTLLKENKSKGAPFDIPMFVKEYEEKLIGVMEELKANYGSEADSSSPDCSARPEVIPVNQPLVSILIPSYKAQYFEFALQSAIGQSYQNTEVVVSDDCPTDAIAQIVARYQSIKSIRYEKNKNPDGVGTNNNINCLRMARGEYVKFLYDDDLLMPFAVQYMLDAFLANAAANPRLVLSERWYIDGQNRFLGANRLPFEHLTDITDHYVERFMALRNANMLGEFTTAMWRRDDSFDENDIARFTRIDGREIVALVDVAMWINLAQLGRVLYIPLPLSCFRKHEAQNSSATGSHWYYRMATEWEVVIDHALERKLISIQEALPALDALLAKYRSNQANFEQLKSFGDRLETRLNDLRAVEGR